MCTLKHLIRRQRVMPSRWIHATLRGDGRWRWNANKYEPHQTGYVPVVYRLLAGSMNLHGCQHRCCPKASVIWCVGLSMLMRSQSLAHMHELCIKTPILHETLVLYQYLLQRKKIIWFFFNSFWCFHISPLTYSLPCMCLSIHDLAHMWSVGHMKVNL